MLCLWSAPTGNRGKILNFLQRHRRVTGVPFSIQVRSVRGVRGLSLLPALMAALGLMPASRVMGQIFTVLHTFPSASAPDGANDDGANPSGGLMLSGNTFYGTATYGGSSGWGTVFSLNLDGTGFSNLYN